MDDLKSAFDQLKDQIENIKVGDKVVTNEDLDRLEERLNKRIDDEIKEDLDKLEKRLNIRIDDIKRDLKLFCSIISIFLVAIVALIVKFVD